jgi:hypothetical protein
VDDAIDPVPVDLLRAQIKAELFAHHSREEAAHRVLLPMGAKFNPQVLFFMDGKFTQLLGRKPKHLVLAGPFGRRQSRRSAVRPRAAVRTFRYMNKQTMRRYCSGGVSLK